MEGGLGRGCEQRHRCLWGQAFNNDYKLELVLERQAAAVRPAAFEAPPSLGRARPPTHEETLQLCSCLWERMPCDATATERSRARHGEARRGGGVTRPAIAYSPKPAPNCRGAVMDLEQHGPIWSLEENRFSLCHHSCFLLIFRGRGGPTRKLF
ncbi:hypothetical protein AAFF_G00397720 [Aldrovandia affinis]|uniref:Uncharacterized protein n=1 Tax=Aldrovandia affinis TaxID=143900 RepID=A0AAD7SD46_9TELE|nr:hypothetical protein AAFF_G00397720 [Aldrovandia affinis]